MHRVDLKDVTVAAAFGDPPQAFVAGGRRP
jgi:hypothetical protein